MTPEERESNPGTGQYVFIQAGDIIDKRGVAIIDNEQALGLWVNHRCQDSERWFIQPNKALPSRSSSRSKLWGESSKVFILASWRYVRWA
ncbi:hypothetical protein CEK60_00360 [Halomonas sp. N3-2A]|nr:hypothetical protein CEK60_00360 [Halomonas sp. N3-2A]